MRRRVTGIIDRVIEVQTNTGVNPRIARVVAIGNAQEYRREITMIKTAPLGIGQG